MTDIGAGWPTQLPVHLGLERHDRQDVVHVGAHGPCPARAPRPDRRRDIVHDGNVGGGRADASCDRMRETRAVDNDERVRAPRDYLFRGRAHQPQDSWKALRNAAKSDDRTIVDRMKACDAFLRHLASAHAGKAQLFAGAFSQRAHQRGAEMIARFLSGYEKEVKHPAVRVASCAWLGRTPTTNSFAPSAATPIRSGSAMIAHPAVT